MKTLSEYIVEDALYRDGTGIEAQVGDQVKLYLDTVSVPGFPEFILGVIQNPITRVNCESATSYEIEYDEADLNGAASAIVPDNVTSVEVVSHTDVLEDALNDEIARATAAEAAIQADVDQNEIDSDAADSNLQSQIHSEVARAVGEEADIRAEFAVADGLLQIRPLERTAAEGAPLSKVVGQTQTVRLSPTGLVTTSGDALLSFDSTVLAGSPKAYDIPVVLNDGPTEICIAVAAALTADSDVTDAFSVVNNGTSVDVSTLAVGGYFPADDPSFQLDILDNTSVGVNTVISTDEQSGIATVDATDPTHVGRWSRVGDTEPYDWYQADTLDSWQHRFHDGDPVGFNADQGVYQRLVISGTSGAEIITVTDL